MLKNYLDGSEKTKADRFRFEKDRQDYIVSHAAKREILAKYTELSPHAVEFAENEYGKPFLAENPRQIYFNLSHSGEIALLAVGKCARLGVDIEFYRTDYNELEIAGQFFSASEIETLRSLPGDMRRKSFFDCWTRKEAFTKAVGLGLMYPLKEFSVSLSPFESARLTAVQNEQINIEGWQIIELKIAENCAATVAVEARKMHAKTFLWNLCSNDF